MRSSPSILHLWLYTFVYGLFAHLQCSYIAFQQPTNQPPHHHHHHQRPAKKQRFYAYLQELYPTAKQVKDIMYDNFWIGLVGIKDNMHTLLLLLLLE